ncbi:NAD(P)-dependent oxidoreductase [Microlunatus parietis]|uniref:Phosphoglycerate dehydrogenase-like enzyme n=1 Tax=Microlunatus parietis TaxID=682979 RepID=A0A7Y9IBX1_9ACTN|nr:NAD(P)-dependent oxidoreductase [Microlunatus parietis]NYE73459.1 phosphoglycerate dehydrogenase-like enzyme [Microlunatus parietis]
MGRLGVLADLFASLPSLAGELERSGRSWAAVEADDPGPHPVETMIIGGQRFGADRLDRCPALRLLVRAGIGLDLIDLDHAARRGIRVINTPGYGTEEVADHALMLLLATVRRLPYFIGQGGADWRSTDYSGVRRLRGSTLGVIGLGAIGSAVANRAEAFGMRIVYTDPYVESPSSQRIRLDLPELLAISDVITLHAPLTTETRCLLDAAAFGRLERRPVIINTARGGLIDTAALLAALADGRIAGAGLDVTDTEPEPPRALLEHPAVIVTPHVAWYSEASRHDMARLAVAAATAKES